MDDKKRNMLDRRKPSQFFTDFPDSNIVIIIFKEQAKKMPLIRDKNEGLI
jgi:hypothetical protein